MTDEYFMNKALEKAKKALLKDEVPIGAIIVKDNKIIAASYNTKELSKIATHHAEINVINIACKKLKTWHLEDCVLYTTVEPCLMCTGAIIQSRIQKVVYGTDNEAFGYLRNIKDKIEVVSHIKEEECKKLLSDFFKEKRNK